MADKKTETRRTNTSTSTRRKNKRASGGSAIAFFMIFFVAGIILGAFVCQYVTREDMFAINGSSNIYIPLNADYLYGDEGVTVVSFGQNISSEVTTKSNIEKNSEGEYMFDTSHPAKYFIKYKVNSFKYRNVERIRTFTVGELQ